MLRQFEAFVGERFDHVGRPRDAGRRECMAWIHSLRGEFEPSSIATDASSLNRFYDYLTRVGVFDDDDSMAGYGGAVRIDRRRPVAP